MTDDEVRLRASIVTLDAKTTDEAAAMMRALGYRSTGELRWKVQGLTVERITSGGLVPTVARFRRSGRLLHNAFYWTADQERAVAQCSIDWLLTQVDHRRTQAHP